MDGMSYWQRSVSRRGFLRAGGIGAAGLAAAALVGCGDEDEGPATPGSGTATGTPASSGTGTSTSTLSRGGILKVGDKRDFLGEAGLDPHVSPITGPWWRIVFDPLVGSDASGQPDAAAGLSESWEILDDTTLVFTLRSGVKFHDGTDFNAEAAKYNLDRARNADLPVIWAGTLGGIESVDAVDDTTLRLNLKQIDASLLTTLSDRGALQSSPTHVEKTLLDDLAVQPVGSGPFRLKEWRAGSGATFVQVPDYWRRREDGGSFALLDEIHNVAIPDDVVLAAAVQSGEVDMIDAPDSQLDLLEGDPNLDVSEFIGVSRQGFWPNHGIYPMDNVDVRKALSYAYNGQAVMDTFFAGRGALSQSVLTPSNWAYSPHDVFGFDMEKAKEHIAKAGVPAEDLVFKFVTTATTSQALQLVAKDWEQIGVKVEEVPYEIGNTKMWMGRGQEGGMHGFFGGGHRADPHVTMAQFFQVTGGWNLGQATVGDLEQMVADGIATFDIEERKRIYAEIQKIHSEQLYCVVPKFDTNRYMYYRKGITGLEFLPEGMPYINGVGITA